MTLTEKAICELYTGVCFCQGYERAALYNYADHLMGHIVYTHEFPALADELKKKSSNDFYAVCAGTQPGWSWEEGEKGNGQ